MKGTPVHHKHQKSIENGKVKFSFLGIPDENHIEIDLHRPYVGTYHHSKKIKKNRNDGRKKLEDIQRFAIAAARTTPEYYDDFKYPGKYLSQSTPPRNIVYPFDDIIYFSRRGFSIIRFVDDDIKIDSKSSTANLIFRTAVVETIIICIMITLVTGATAKKIEEVIDEIGRTFIEEMDKEKLKTRNPSEKAIKLIQDFSDALDHLRIFLSINEVMVNIKPNLKTNSAVFAVKRLEKYNQYTEMIESAKKSLESYTALMASINNFWQVINLRWLKISVCAAGILAIMGIILGIIFNTMPDETKKSIWCFIEPFWNMNTFIAFPLFSSYAWLFQALRLGLVGANAPNRR
jgi:hypothetical protein